jgi:hypothetical protein
MKILHPPHKKKDTACQPCPSIPLKIIYLIESISLITIFKNQPNNTKLNKYMAPMGSLHN